MDEIKLDELLPSAHPQPSSALPQSSEKVVVTDIEKTVDAEIGRKSAAIAKHTRRSLADIYDHVRVSPDSIASGQLEYDVDRVKCVRA